MDNGNDSPLAEDSQEVLLPILVTITKLVSVATIYDVVSAIFPQAIVFVVAVVMVAVLEREQTVEEFFVLTIMLRLLVL